MTVLRTDRKHASNCMTEENGVEKVKKRKNFFEVPKSPGNPGFFRSGPVRRALTNGPEAGMIRLKELDETG